MGIHQPLFLRFSVSIHKMQIGPWVRRSGIRGDEIYCNEQGISPASIGLCIDQGTMIK